MNDAGFLYKRPDVDLELCASKKYSWNLIHFQFGKKRDILKQIWCGFKP